MTTTDSSATGALPPRVDRLRAALARMTRRRAPRLPPPQVLVRTPAWEFAFGDVDRPFHAASSGKLVTAAVIGRLVDRRLLSFDDEIGGLLPAADIALLHPPAGVEAARLTVDHLLSQTGGVPDYFEPPKGHASIASVESAIAHPHRRFTPTDLLTAGGALPWVGRPGERFHYSDTNYVLLGRIIEEVGGLALARAMRAEVFEPCGMASAHTPYDATLIEENLDSLDVAPFWIGRHELTRAHSVSLDWAGGNVVATPADWATFSREFHSGRLVSPAVLEHLTRVRHRFRRGIHYGAGTMTLRFGELLPPLMRGLPEPIGHLGYWATHVFHYPRQQAEVVLNFHTSRAMNASFQVHARIARILDQSIDQRATVLTR